MNRVVIGSIGIIIGGIVLSLELYCLKFIEILEIQNRSLAKDAIGYLGESSIKWSIFIIILVIVYSVCLFASGLKHINSIHTKSH